LSPHQILGRKTLEEEEAGKIENHMAGKREGTQKKGSPLFEIPIYAWTSGGTRKEQKEEIVLHRDEGAENNIKRKWRVLSDKPKRHSSYITSRESMPGMSGGSTVEGPLQNQKASKR